MNNLFRISINRFVFALATVLLFSSLAFAGEPVPGMDVGAGKNPGGIIIKTKTDTDGKFTFAPADSGSYNITFTGSEKRMPFVLKFTSGNTITVNNRRWASNRSITVTATTKIMVIAVKHEITISGTITKPDTSR